MDSAKAAVKDFMKKSGHDDTTVHEQVAPAVQHETIQRAQHENVTTAVDKEVHQDHYHTSVQPVQHKEVLPEQHHHNIIPVEHKSYEHDDASRVKQKLATEAQQFRDTTQKVEGSHTSSVNPVVGGQHTHHHIHETIQPVVDKQTVEPHVVHTTVPIHEVHHNAAQHHSTSALPAVSMSDFKKQGGVLTGREERYDGFEGAPRNVGGSLGSESTGTHTGHHHGTTGSSGLTSGTTGSSGLGHSSHTGTTGSSGLTGGSTGSSGLGHSDRSGTSGLTSGTTGSSGLGHSGTSGSSGYGHSGTTGSSGLESDRVGTDGAIGSDSKLSTMDKIKDKLTGSTSREGDVAR